MKSINKILTLSTFMCSVSSIHAYADIAYSPTFSGSNEFILEGRSSINSDGIQMLGGLKGG